LLAVTGSLLIGLVVVLVFVPSLLIYPAIVVLAWMAVALLYRAFRLRVKGKHGAKSPPGAADR
jgi:hypothetical protein